MSGSKPVPRRKPNDLAETRDAGVASALTDALFAAADVYPSNLE